jgi:hypothetical protein
MYKYMEFYLLNWVQFFYDFGMVISSVSTQGYFHTLALNNYYE